jgi:phage baseplate assembly protein gpV
VTELENMIRGIVAEQLANMGQGRHAIVSAVNPTEPLVRVSWDEEGTQSGWLPVAQMAAGAGWGASTLPTVGTQVYVAPDMGDLRHGVVLGAVHSTSQPVGTIQPYGGGVAIPPVPGEPTFRHPSGSTFRLTAGGVIEMNGTVKINGTLLVSGDISDQNGAHGTLALLRTDHNAHTHGGVQSGSAQTAAPNLVTP